MSFFSSLPYSKYSVYQKATQETQNYIGPRIPGIQQHEFCGVHLHILCGKKTELFFQTDLPTNKSKYDNLKWRVVIFFFCCRVSFLTICKSPGSFLHVYLTSGALWIPGWNILVKDQTFCIFYILIFIFLPALGIPLTEKKILSFSTLPSLPANSFLFTLLFKNSIYSFFPAKR